MKLFQKIRKNSKCLYSIRNLLFILFFQTLSSKNIENTVEEIIVYASLVPIDSRVSASSITIINREQIENRAVTSISEIMREVPGLAVSKSGVQGSQTQIRVRGSEANHLLVLIDGIEVNDPSQNDELNWGTLSADNIEKIEIIRGPLSALFGSDAVSGVVNIITKNAILPRSIKIFSEHGSFKTKNYGATIGIKDINFDALFGFSNFITDGENISINGNEKDGYENKNLTLKSRWKINEYLNTVFSARRSGGMNEYDSDINFDGIVDDQNNESKFRNTITGLKLKYINPDNIWQHDASISRSKNDNQDFQNNLNVTRFTSTKDQIRFINTFYWSEFSNRVSILKEYEIEKFSQQGMVNDYGVYGIFDPNQNQTKKTKSIAVELRGYFLGSNSFAASMRHDNNSEFKNSNTYRFEITHNPRASSKIRAAYGTAIKNPTFTERFGFYTNFIGNPFLQPEKSTSWELGLDQKFLNDSLNISTTIFNSELQNEINGNAIDPITFGYTAINKAGLSKRNGLEITTFGNLGKKIFFSAAYTYTDSKELDSNRQYQDEVRRPKHIGSLSMSWDKNDILSFNANLRYNGSQKDFAYPNNVKLADYIIVNINASLKINKNLDAYIRLENLFNESYEEVYSYQTHGFGAHIGFRYEPSNSSIY